MTLGLNVLGQKVTMITTLLFHAMERYLSINLRYFKTEPFATVIKRQLIVLCLIRKCNAVKRKKSMISPKMNKQI